MRIAHGPTEPSRADSPSIGGHRLAHEPGADTLSRRAYTALRRAIRDGYLRPGQYYSEHQLAAVMEVSRTPVREALIELAREGAVIKVPQKGFRLHVASATEIEEAYDLRTLIERYVVGRFTVDATPETTAALLAMVDAQRAAMQDPRALSDVDEQFHLGMASLIGLQRCHQALLLLRAPVWLPGAAASQDTTRLEEALNEHRAIVEQMMAGDAEGAVEAVSRHIERSRLAARKRWSELPSGSR